MGYVCLCEYLSHATRCCAAKRRIATESPVQILNHPASNFWPGLPFSQARAGIDIVASVRHDGWPRCRDSQVSRHADFRIRRSSLTPQGVCFWLLLPLPAVGRLLPNLATGFYQMDPPIFREAMREISSMSKKAPNDHGNPRYTT